VQAVIDEKHDRRIFLRKQDSYYRYSRPIALLLFQIADSGQDTNCTGFPVTETIFVTNYHCISKKWQIRTAMARFDYEIAANGIEPFDVKFSGLLRADKDLDFSLLRMTRPVSKEYVARYSTEDLRPNQNLVLMQHPDALKKEIVSDGCMVQFTSAAGLGTDLTDFYHLCDSSSGSSGSPVLDANTGRVVGVHHLGRFDPKSTKYHNLALKIPVLLKSLEGSNEPFARGLYSEIIQKIPQ